MPIQDPGIIAAFEAGRRARLEREQIAREEQQFQMEQQDRELEQEELKLRLADLKLQGKLRARDAAIKQIGMIESLSPGQMSPEMYAEPPGMPSKSLGMAIGAPGGEPSDQASVPNRPTPLKPVNVPGVEEWNLPGMAITPRTLAEVMGERAAAARAEELSKPRTLSPGQVFGFPGEAPLMTGGEREANYQSVSRMVNGKPMTLDFNPVTREYFRAGSNEPVTGDIRPIPRASEMGGQGTGGTPMSVLTTRPDPKTGDVIDPNSGLTPNAIFQNGVNFALQGKMPTMGMGNQSQVRNARMAIQNTAAALAAKAGVDLPTLQQEYKQNATTLNKMVPFYHATKAYADSALASMNFALDQSAKFPRTGSPLVNRYKQWALGRTLTGDPALSRFEVFVYTASRDYAKVTSGAALSIQALTDSAADKADELLNAAQTPGQFEAAIGAMQQDMNNVMDTYKAQIGEVSQTVARLLDATEQAPTQAPTTGLTLPGEAGGTATPPPAGKTVKMLAPDGKTEKDVPADQVEYFRSKGASIVQAEQPKGESPESRARSLMSAIQFKRAKGEDFSVEMAELQQIRDQIAKGK